MYTVTQFWVQFYGCYTVCFCSMRSTLHRDGVYVHECAVCVSGGNGDEVRLLRGAFFLLLFSQIRPFKVISWHIAQMHIPKHAEFNIFV